MSSDIAIRVDRLSNLYRIGAAEQRQETLVGAVTSFLKSPLQNHRNLHKLSKFDDVVSDEGPRTTDQSTSSQLWAVPGPWSSVP